VKLERPAAALNTHFHRLQPDRLQIGNVHAGIKTKANQKCFKTPSKLQPRLRHHSEQGDRDGMDTFGKHATGVTRLQHSCKTSANNNFAVKFAIA
jgi:hypothetical protein